jgi:ATP synthase protein I
LSFFDGVILHLEEHTDLSEKKMWRQATRYGAVGLEMGIAVLIGIFGGQYLDDWLDTEPVFFWVGFALGLGAAAKAIYDAARSAKRMLSGNGTPSSGKD